MRLEQVPLFIGVIVAIMGLGLVLDAQLPEGFSQSRERRRRARTERNRPGETLVGLGVIGMAAALIGSDEWRFGTVAVLAGVAPAGTGRGMETSLEACGTSVSGEPCSTTAGSLGSLP